MINTSNIFRFIKSDYNIYDILIALDKQAPVVSFCTEEQEVITGTGSRIAYTENNCTFQDNVDGKMRGVFVDPYKSIAFPRGDYKNMYYKAEDISGNKAEVKQRFLVHGT